MAGHTLHYDFPNLDGVHFTMYENGVVIANNIVVLFMSIDMSSKDDGDYTYEVEVFDETTGRTTKSDPLVVKWLALPAPTNLRLVFNG